MESLCGRIRPLLVWERADVLRVGGGAVNSLRKESPRVTLLSVLRAGAGDIYGQLLAETVKSPLLVVASVFTRQH